jgi:hypothetical protein
MRRFVVASLLCLAATLVVQPSAARASEWAPEAWTDVDTLEFQTDCPDEGPYWSPIWLSTIDGEVYVALGSRAGARLECSSTKPRAAIRIEGQVFDDVEFVEVPEMAERIEESRSDKYFTNMFLFGVNHRYYRLVPSGS